MKVIIFLLCIKLGIKSSEAVFDFLLSLILVNTSFDSFQLPSCWQLIATFVDNRFLGIPPDKANFTTEHPHSWLIVEWASQVQFLRGTGLILRVLIK